MLREGRVRVALIALLAGGRSGVPRYTVSLARALDRVSDEFPRLDLTLITTEPGAAEIGSSRLPIEHAARVLGQPRRGFRRLLAEQVAALASAADVLHFFDLTGPLLAPGRRFVSTLHDAASTYRRRSVRSDYKRFVQPWALRRAAAIVAVSAFSRDEAVRRLGVDPARIHVIHSGPGLEAQAASNGGNRSAVSDFLLYVGDLSTHKNLPFLVDVFERAGTPEKLVLAGRPGPGYDDLRRRIGVSNRIVTIVDPDDAEVDQLYREALATVLPSRYEGFGFTPLEAMARGCPVIASDIPAVREIADDGALLVPLDAESAWVEAVRALAGDDGLRSRLRAGGNEVVSRYSWERTARGVCRLFLRLAPN